MDKFRTRIAGHAILALDTSIFIYHFEAHPRYLPLTQIVLDRIQQGHSRGITSIITLMELTVHPWRENRPSIAQHYEVLLVNFPNLTMPVVRRAAQLRAAHNTRPADALHLATALCEKATAFVTNDIRLLRCKEEIDIILLEHFACGQNVEEN